MNYQSKLKNNEDINFEFCLIFFKGNNDIKYIFIKKIK